MQRTRLNENGCNLAQAFVEFCLDDSAASGSVGIGSELFNFCADENLFKQFFNAHTCLCRHSDNGSIAAPFFGSYAVFCELRKHSVGVCARSVHLVESNDDRHVCLFCVADSLYCLRHDTVICRNDKMAISVTIAPRARMDVNAS